MNARIPRAMKSMHRGAYPVALLLVVAAGACKSSRYVPKQCEDYGGNAYCIQRHGEERRFCSAGCSPDGKDDDGCIYAAPSEPGCYFPCGIDQPAGSCDEALATDTSPTTSATGDETTPGPPATTTSTGSTGTSDTTGPSDTETSVDVMTADAASVTDGSGDADSSTGGGWCPGSVVPCLGALTVDGGLLAPAFSPDVTSYDVEVGYWTTEISITAAPQPGAHTRIAGARTENASVSLTLGDNPVDVVVTDETGTTTYTITTHRRAPVRLDAPNGAEGFGLSVALSGGLLVVGAPRSSDGNGAAYTFVRATDGSWEQVVSATLSPSSAGFGDPLVLDGDHLAVSAPLETVGEDPISGAVYVYRWTGSGWQPDAGTPLRPGGANHGFGTSIDLQGGSLVGATDNVSLVHTFSFGASSQRWTQDSNSPLEADDATAFIEAAVGLDDDLLVVGMHNRPTPGLFMYLRDTETGAWERTTTSPMRRNGLFGSQIALVDGVLVVNGEPVFSTTEDPPGTWFAQSLEVDSRGQLAFDGERIVVAAPVDEAGDVAVAEVRVYTRDEASEPWRPVSASPLLTEATAEQGFGAAVAVAGSTVAVGAPGLAPNGVVYVYE